MKKLFKRKNLSDFFGHFCAQRPCFVQNFKQAAKALFSTLPTRGQGCSLQEINSDWIVQHFAAGKKPLWPVLGVTTAGLVSDPYIEAGELPASPTASSVPLRDCRALPAGGAHAMNNTSKSMKKRELRPGSGSVGGCCHRSWWWRRCFIAVGAASDLHWK